MGYPDIGNIRHNRAKKMSNNDPTKNRCWTQVLVKGKQFFVLL